MKARRQVQQMINGGALRHALHFLDRNILVLSVTDLLGNLARSMVFPYVSLYILALGGEPAQIGVVNAIQPLAGLVAFPIAGYVADRANRVSLIVAANLYMCALVALRMLAPTWEWIALAALIQGFAVFGFPPRSALIADSLAPENRGRGIAAMNTIASGLAIFAPYIAGVVVDAYGANIGVRILYAAMLALYLTNAAIQFRFLKDPRPPSGQPLAPSDLGRVLREVYAGIPALVRQFPRSLKALAGVIILSFMSNGVASAFWVVYAVEQIGLSASEWGLILLVETVLRLLMFMPAGVLVDRWGRATSLRVALLLSLVVIPSFLLAQGFVSALLVRSGVAIAFAIAIPACTALMADIVPREIRGRVMSALGQGGIMIGAAGGGTGGPAVGFMVTLPLMLASLAGGYLYTANPAYPWLFVALATALALLLTVLFIRDPRTAEV